MFSRLKNIASRVFREQEAPDCGPGSAIVNYVWINRKKYAPRKTEPLCGVPLKAVDKLIDNALRYPQASFRLWLDKAFLDDMSLFFVAAHIYNAGAGNVEIHDLRDIPAYRDHSLFHGQDIVFQGGDELLTDDPQQRIWVRVDLARLLVLQHCARTTSPSQANVFYYSDFDAEDVGLECPIAQSSLQRYGLFFGTVFGRIENGFMAFDRWQSDRLLSRIISETMKAVPKNEPNGYNQFCEPVSEWRALRFFISKKRYSAPRLYSMGYRIPDNELYQDCDLN